MEITQNKKEKKHNPLWRGLNKFFKFEERGTNFKREIFAGLLSFLCIAGTALVVANLLSEGTAQTTGMRLGHVIFFLIALMSAISSITVGLVCNVPVVHSVSLATVSLILSIYGKYQGLTYFNILAIAFVSNLIYLAIMLVKPVREFIFKAIPDTVKRALPVAIGMLIIGFVLVQLDILQVNNYDLMHVLTNYAKAGDPMSKVAISYVTLNFDFFKDPNYFYSYMPIIIALCIVIVAAILRNIKIKNFTFKHPVIDAFGIGLLIYIIFWVVRGNFTDYYLYSFIVPSYGAMYFGSSPLPVITMIKNNYLLSAFQKGFDFSAFKAAVDAGTSSGNVFFIFLSSILSFVVLGISETGSVVKTMAYQGQQVNEEGQLVTNISRNGFGWEFANVYSVTAAVNVVGSILGCMPVSARHESTVGGEEGGRTGLTAVVAGLLFIVTMFNMIFNGLFVNGILIYGLMLLAGFSLLSNIRNIDFGDKVEFVPALLMIVSATFTQDIVLALTIGVVSYVVMQLITFKIKNIKIGTAILAAILLINLIF